MKMPFTTDEFFKVFEQYNESIFPAQFILILFALLAVFFLFSGMHGKDRWISIFISVKWLWTALVYHVLFFSGINPAAVAFGGLFLLQGLLFLWEGGIRGKIRFSPGNSPVSWAGYFFILYALVIYPVLGYFLGHVYPASPTFGAPCPLVIFTFGLLLLTGRLPKYLVIIPFLWALIGSTAAINFDVTEDYMLLASGLITFFYIILRKKDKRAAST